MGRSFSGGATFTGLFLAGLLGLVAVQAQARDIDDFNVATETDLFRMSGPGGLNGSPLLSKDQDGNGILGGERDFLVTYNGSATSGPYANSAIGAIGRPDIGMLEVATAGVFGSSITIQYDGIDSEGDPGATALSDALGLGPIDLTDGGLSDRFRINIATSQAQNGTGNPLGDGLEVLIRVQGADQVSGHSAVLAAAITETQDPSFLDLLFADFEFLNGGTLANTFGSAASITVIFNPNFVPNADFAIDSIQTVPVPEPSTLALLGIAGVAGLIVRARSRRG